MLTRSSQCFPEIYAWATFPVTSLIEAVWKHHIEQMLCTVVRANRAREELPKPKPQYVELLAVLERLLNYGYTGAAQALPRQLMQALWPGRSLLDTGFPVLWPGLDFGTDGQCIPHVILKSWPLNPATHRPLTASKSAQQITYGLSHYLVRLHSTCPGNN